MPNDYFQFKQFTIHQDKCAMKVCTDACLFGAWIAQSPQLTAHKILDIGTGTGLLSLILAQNLSNAIIDAVEIDEAAAQQAKENFEASPWKERLTVYTESIQYVNLSTNHLYDIIISNPPFYKNDLKSDNEKRNLALHSAELSLEELVTAVNKFLKDDGSFFVLLPYHRIKYFEESAIEQNLFIKEKIFIKQTPKHNYFRSILWLTKNPAITTQSEITIMNNENQYTKEFGELLKDYYLYL
jgi:tRNA1Val (adenine37-N6)-methyltransferase